QGKDKVGRSDYPLVTPVPSRTCPSTLVSKTVLKPPSPLDLALALQATRPTNVPGTLYGPTSILKRIQGMLPLDTIGSSCPPPLRCAQVADTGISVSMSPTTSSDLVLRVIVPSPLSSWEAQRLASVSCQHYTRRSVSKTVSKRRQSACPNRQTLP